jgi:hypothetical protein
MVGRWGLFQHFLIDHLSVSERYPLYETLSIPKIEDDDRPNVNDDLIQSLLSHECQKAFDMMLETYYLPLELHYLKTIIETVRSCRLYYGYWRHLCHKGPSTCPII